VVLSGVLLERDDVPSVGAGEVEGVGVLAGGVRGEEREDGLGVGSRGSRAIFIVIFLAREERGPRARRVRGGEHVLRQIDVLLSVDQTFRIKSKVAGV